MKDTQAGWKEATEVAKNAAQIVAIAVAAIWTWLVFIRTEGPLLEARAAAGSDIVWQTTSAPDTCIAAFAVQLENIGKASFTIDRVEVKVWSFSRVPGEAEGLHFVDLTEIQESEPLFAREFETGPFTQRYSPGESFRHAFEWVVRKGDLQELFFRIDFFEDDATVASWHTGSWSPACGWNDRGPLYGEPLVGTTEGISEAPN